MLRSPHHGRPARRTQHAADLVRLPLLHTHLDRLFWDALTTAAASPYEMGAWIIAGQLRRPWSGFGN